jgi:hypothetical protein
MKTLQNIKIAAGFLLLAVLATSCIEDNVVPAGDKGQVLIKLNPASSSGFFFKVAEPSNQPQTFPLLDVRRDAPNAAALNATTVVTLKFDPAILTVYNAKNGKSFIPIPEGAYTTSPAAVAGNIVITFGPGEFAKEVSLTIPNAFNLNPANQYAMGYKMEVTSGSGVLSTGSKDSLVVQVLPKNQWDGKYKMKGDVLRPGDLVLGGPFTNQDYTLNTTGARTVKFSRLQCWANGSNVGGIGLWSIEVAANGTDITVTDPGVAANFEMVPGYPHRYDPALKTFFFQVQWGTAVPRNRGATDTLVWVGPSK